MKRLFCVVLLVIFLCGIFVGCKKDSNPSSEETEFCQFESEYYERGVLVRKILFDDRGNPTDKISYDKNGEESSHEFWKYGKSNVILEEGEYRKGEFSWKKTHTYNKDGQLLKSWEYEEDGSKTLLLKNTYDDKGNLIEKQTSGSRIVIKYDSQGNEKEYEYYSDDVLGMYILNEYNQNGKKLRESRFENGELSCQYDYKYNDLGKLVEYTRFYKDYGTSRSEYRYDANGNTIYYVEFDNDVEVERTECVFDSNNNKLENREYENGVIVDQDICEYYENNTCKKKIDIDYENGQEKHRSIYEYDENGTKKSSTNLYSSGVTNHTEYVYNENGDIKSRINTDSSGNTSRFEYVYNENGLLGKVISNKNGEVSVSSEYEYDANGNKIKCTEYMSDYNEVHYYKYDANGNVVEYKFQGENGKTRVTKYKYFEMTKERADSIKKQLYGEI